MASKRDLVEAHAFNRRRLVTAFLSGAPGGREVEPVRYARPLVGGVLAAALVLGGAAVTGVLKPAVAKDWNTKNGFIIGKDSGSPFVVFGDKHFVYPMTNVASARLLLGPDEDFKATYVPDDLINKQEPQRTYGINGAPNILAKPSQMIQSGWTACTNSDGGVKLEIAKKPPAAAATGQALIVKSSVDGKQYVVSGTRRYVLPSGKKATNAILLGLGLDRQTPYEVPGQWLDLLTSGSTLKLFSVPGSGTRKGSGVAGLDAIGTPVKIGNRGYVYTGQGLVPLSDFAYSIYKVSAGSRSLKALSLNAGEIAGKLQTLPEASERPYPSDWPTANVTPFSGNQPCLELDKPPSTSAVSPVVLAHATNSSAIPTGSAVTVEVQPGHGALVRAATPGTANSAGTVFLIDARGTRYAVGSKGNTVRDLTALGYGKTPIPAIPQAWTKLFGDGPALNNHDASQPADQ